MMRTLGATLPLPAYRYWIPTGVLDQNGFPHCVGYAWSQWLRCSPTRTLDGPNGDAIYREAQTLDEWEGEAYDGTSVRGGAKALENDGRFGEYVWATDDLVVKNWLARKGPVVLGTDWYSGMFTPDFTGTVHLTGSIEGGHAYLAIGYSDMRQSFRCINSWGAGWGQRGRFWLPYAYLTTLLASNGEACGAQEVSI